MHCLLSCAIKELKSEVPATDPSTSTGQCQSVHPFVPYLKQERSMDVDLLIKEMARSIL
jgi:hypothetical protein